jgi:hypothetical protein
MSDTQEIVEVEVEVEVDAEESIINNMRQLIKTLSIPDRCAFIEKLSTKEQMDLVYGFNKEGTTDGNWLDPLLELDESTLTEEISEELPEDLEDLSNKPSNVFSLPSMKVPVSEVSTNKPSTQPVLGKKELKRLKRKEEKQKNKPQIVRGYVESDRQKIVTEFYMSISNLNISHIITADIKKMLADYVANGTEYDTVIPIPDYGRSLVIKLYNTRNKKTYINFQQESTVTEYGEKKGNYTTGPIGEFRKKVDQLKKQGIDYTTSV